jgi:hypothetical protein
LEYVGPYITLDKLVDMAHGLDTNMNEAFNQICTWFAPKNKVFAGSGSLHNRIAMAVGINSLGVEAYFKRLYDKLGIELTNNVLHYQKKFALLKRQTDFAKTARYQREGTYRPGMNLDDPDAEIPQEVLDALAAQKKRRSRGVGGPADKKQKLPEYCPFCGKKGHVTTKAKSCQQFGNAKAEQKFKRTDGTLIVLLPPAVAVGATPAELQALLLAAAAVGEFDDEDDAPAVPISSEYEEEDDYAAIPWNSELEEHAVKDDDDDDIFHDAGTWEEDHAAVDPDRVI